MSATLGGVIKDLRMQKNLSQIELAFALGWKEPSRISRLEQGKSGNPSREFLDELMAVMNLSSEERNYVLYVGGYVPNDKDIREEIEKMSGVIDEWPYPASMLDFSWRTIYSNRSMYNVYGVSSEQQSLIMREKPNILEIVFDENFVLNRVTTDFEKEKRDEFLTRMLFQFRYESRSRTKDGWYIELVAKLMKNELFQRTWKKSYQFDQLNFADLANFGLKRIPDPNDSKGYLTFHFFLASVFKNPRFNIEMHTPADEYTFQYFRK